MPGDNQLGGFGEHARKRRTTKRSVFRPYASILGFPFLFGMPSRRIAEYSVEEFIPRSRAAPAGPLIRQSVLERTETMCLRSASLSVGEGILPALVGISRYNWPPLLTITACSMTFRNSRMLPGQE